MRAHLEAPVEAAWRLGLSREDVVTAVERAWQEAGKDAAIDHRTLWQPVL